MKVLEKKKWQRKVKCYECKSKLLVEAGDVRCWNAAIGYAGETWEPRYYFKCPECKSDEDIDELPDHVMENAKGAKAPSV